MKDRGGLTSRSRNEGAGVIGSGNRFQGEGNQAVLVSSTSSFRASYRLILAFEASGGTFNLNLEAGGRYQRLELDFSHVVI